MSEPTRCNCPYNFCGNPPFKSAPFLETVNAYQFAFFLSGCAHRKWEVEGESEWTPSNIYLAPPRPFNPSTKFADCFFYKIRNYTSIAYSPSYPQFNIDTGAFLGYTAPVSYGVCDSWQEIREFNRDLESVTEGLSTCTEAVTCNVYDNPAFHNCSSPAPTGYIDTLWSTTQKYEPEPLCPPTVAYLPFQSLDTINISFPPQDGTEGQSRGGFFPLSRSDLNGYYRNYQREKIRWVTTIPVSGYCKVTWDEIRTFYKQKPECLDFVGCYGGPCFVQWEFDKEEVIKRSATMTGTCPIDRDPSRYYIASDPIEVDLGVPQAGVWVGARIRNVRYSYVQGYEPNGASCPNGYPPFNPTPCL